MAIKPAQLRAGACYSNGEFGKNWTVWQVAEISVTENELVMEPCLEMVRYRILVGKNRRKYMSLSRQDFAEKVRYEVELIESTWQRIE